MTDSTQQQPASILDEPTNEYNLRHAANLLFNFAREQQAQLTLADIDVLNFAYQQLLRGANTLHAAQKDAL